MNKCIRCGECCQTVPCIFAQVRYGLDQWDGKSCPELKVENGLATCLWIERDPWMKESMIGSGCEKPLAVKTSGAMSFIDVVKECALNKEFVKGFNRLTESHLFEDNRPPIVRMVDDACGYKNRVEEEQHEYMGKFILFVYETVWSRLPEEAFG